MKLLVQIGGVGISILLATLTNLAFAQSDGTQTEPATTTMSPAMHKTIDPNVWAAMMMQMMQSPNPIASCAACHTGEEVARYQKDYGPMLSMMQPAMSMMNPAMLGQMMTPAMGMMTPMMAPAMGMINPMMGMMNPMMGMINPMMGMMNPMMGMMNPAMGMMNPATMGNMMAPAMGMMNPMAMGNMMGPAMGMMGPAMGMMGSMGGMNMPNPWTMGNMMGPMSGMMNPGTATPGRVMPQMMDPKQYEKMFNAWKQMMPNSGQNQAQAESGTQ
jgi:hypothetical protein